MSEELEYYEENIDGIDYSRYKNLDRYKDKSTGNRFIESYREIDIPVSENDKYHQVKASDENRLDLIAYKYYNRFQLWWVIAEANNIQDPMWISSDTILRIPSLDTIYGYGGVLS